MDGCEESCKSWEIYHCELVDMEDTGRMGGSLRAVRVCRDREGTQACDLPEGFVTYPLLDCDFSDDETVLRFVNDYGIVMCPYGGAIERTFAAIEDPTFYRRLLYGLSRRRTEEVEEGGGLGSWLRRLFVPGRFDGDDRYPDPSVRFTGCDAEMDVKDVLYEGMSASNVSEYLRTASPSPGFIHHFEDDRRLVSTERMRALAMNDAAREHANTGQWHLPDCLVSLEEVRETLYLLQLSAAVLQGYAYMDGVELERKLTGPYGRGLRERYAPDATSSEEDRERGRHLANHAVRFESNIRLSERLFSLFFEGRPNLLKALYSVCPHTDASARQPHAPESLLSDEERSFVEGIVHRAEASCQGDEEALALLSARPLWDVQGNFGDGLRDSLAVFVEACLTNCWGTFAYELISTEPLRGGRYEDGGPRFRIGTNRMTLQRAIAGQLVSYLRDAKANWKRCEVCGEPFYLRNKSKKPVAPGKERVRRRNRLPTDPTCSEAHRMRAVRRRP